MEVTALLFYLLITCYITIYVGKVLFTNGRPFLLNMLQDENITDSVNKILITGYYLINLGYVSFMLTIRPNIENVSDLISALATSIGRITLTLGIMHYINISIAALWHKMNIKHKV